mmetsp:Transcript_5569/g.5756  ORF Transcript_5569/g.5756 Transcript_5569/m.5756 type:complete len:119 (+) Transcript_5569:76-432(+)
MHNSLEGARVCGRVKLPPFQDVFGEIIIRYEKAMHESFDLLAKNNIEVVEPLSHNSISTGRWTQEEHIQFLKGIQKYGNDWTAIRTLIPTRTSVQIRTHAQKVAYMNVNKFTYLARFF